MSDTATNAATALGATPSAATALGATSYGPAMVGGVVSDIEAERKKKDAATAPIYQQMQDDYAKDRERFNKAADSYKPVEQTQAPTPPENDPLKGFGSAAGMFAMLASAFTHTPAINAMNGMAAAINATKANDQEAYKTAYKQWKDNTELAIQNHKLQADDMKTAMDMMQSDLSTGVAMAKAVAAQSDDRIATKLLEEGQYEKLAEHMRASSAAAASMAEKAPLVAASLELSAAMKSGDPARIAAAREAYAFAKAPTSAADRPGSKEWQFRILFNDAKAHGATDAEATNKANFEITKASAGGKQAASAEALKPLNDDSADFQARFYLRTGQIPAGFGGQAMRSQIIEKATQIANENNTSVDDILSGRATLKADTGSLAAVTKQKNAAEGYERGAMKSLDLAVSLIPPTPEPLDTQTLTRWARTGATEFGEVAVPKYQAALITALDQYAKVLSGATGAQGSTDSARTLALSLIPPGATSKQIPGIVDVLRKDMANKVGGYNEQISSLQEGIAHPGQSHKGAPSSPGVAPPTPGAKKAPDGKWYVPDPARPGKYLMVQ